MSVTLLATLAVGFGWGTLTDRRHNQGYEYLAAERAIMSQYVESVDREKVMRGCYEGMIDSLGDAYANYYTVDEILQKSEDDKKEKIDGVLRIDRISDRSREYALIWLGAFSPVVENEFAAKVAEHVDYSPDGVILDLRGNMGGIVSAAQAVVGVWIGDEVMARLDNHRGDVEIKRGVGKSLLGGIPVVVLVNHLTASASEIVAGALRDRVSAPLIGTKTYGKGLVQGFVPLPNGAWVKITTHWWHTPSGQSVSPDGLAPDVWIEDVPFVFPVSTIDNLVRAAIERLAQ
jgi:C-terminal processing protease CtpA/Prc